MVKFALNDENDAQRHEIRESFEALDTKKTGRLGIDMAYTLLLGLGYSLDYKKQDEFTPSTLEALAKQIEQEDSENFDNADELGSGIRLETVLTIVATHPALSKRNAPNIFSRRTFELMDSNGKGYIDASDVVRLGESVGKHETFHHQSHRNHNAEISVDEANDMIVTTNQIISAATKAHAKSSEKHNNDPEERLDASVWDQLFAPPSM
mmetsp:Transcript_4858/g.14057  ORF Transcript_4858/g.14057 Transcript_4858/m.14057 type:complete len:209 (+) Transcript_4858:244-870(+)